METHSIPSIIEYGISDNRMIVDLTDPDQIHMVYNELKAKKSQYLTLYEPLYLAKSWTSDCFENIIMRSMYFLYMKILMKETEQQP